MTVHLTDCLDVALSSSLGVRIAQIRIDSPNSLQGILGTEEGGGGGSRSRGGQEGNNGNKLKALHFVG